MLRVDDTEKETSRISYTKVLGVGATLAKAMAIAYEKRSDDVMVDRDEAPSMKRDQSYKPNIFQILQIVGDELKDHCGNIKTILEDRSSNVQDKLPRLIEALALAFNEGPAHKLLWIKHGSKDTSNDDDAIIFKECNERIAPFSDIVEMVLQFFEDNVDCITPRFVTELRKKTKNQFNRSSYYEGKYPKLTAMGFFLLKDDKQRANTKLSSVEQTTVSFSVEGTEITIITNWGGGKS